MPHIDLPEGVPGIRGPMLFRPETAEPLNHLANVLLRGDNTLTRGERELIAARVSRLNDCKYCCDSHSTFAAHQLDGGMETVDCVVDDPDSAPVSPKMKALLVIAGQVQQGGKAVTTEAVEAARAEGATDTEIHDTVLIAATFCMFNRYVDGLATWTPEDRAEHWERGKVIVEHGYGNALK
ncbi:MAG: peroxidase-related enzyme [Microthrixaceae bacterium]|nr:peroxidase-related enzyme [Microthrixaceae bacterium]